MIGESYVNEMAPSGSTVQLKQIEKLLSPFNKLVKVAIVDDDGKEIYYGTGTLLIACYVLTSLHVITRKVKTKDGKYKEEEPRPTVLSAKNIKVFIGQNGENSPGIQCNVLNLAYPEEYLQVKANYRFLYDFAILKIDLTQNYLEDNSLKLSIPAINNVSRMVQLYGYDKNYNQSNSTRKEREKKIYRLYGCKADLLEINEFTIKYKMPTDAGKSGAPLLIYSEHGKYKIIGIHSGAYTKSQINFALRITEPIIIKITELIKQLDKDTRVQRTSIENLNKTNQSYHDRNGNLKQSAQPDRRSQVPSERKVQQEIKLPHRQSLPAKQSEMNALERFNFTVTQILSNFFNFHKKTEVYEDKGEMQRDQLGPRQIAFTLGEILIYQQFQASPVSTQTSQSVVSHPREEANSIKEIQVNTTHLREINDLQPWIRTEKRTTVETLAINFYNSQVRLQDFLDIKFLFRLDNIKKLGLNHCQLQAISILPQLKKLQIVDCSNNYISQIDYFYTPIITDILLNDNCVKEISKKIIEAQSLRTLSIRDNRRALKVHDSIAQLSNLKDLRLDGAPELTINVIEKLQENNTLERFDY